MVPSITTNTTKTIRPMISSTDPFLSGPSALVNPNDILDVEPYSYCYTYQPKDEYADSSMAMSDQLDEILENFTSDEGLTLEMDLVKLEEFVNSMQSDYPSLLSNDYSQLLPNEELSISLPESPLSFEDLANSTVYQELNSFEFENDTAELSLEEAYPIQAIEELLAEQATVEQPIVEEPIAETPKESIAETTVYTARSGRVIKRKIYNEDQLDDDEDYEPRVRKQPKKARFGGPKKATKRIRVYDDETKRQNMIAARRYREKKRVEQVSVDEVYEIEANKNDKLRKEVEQLQSEIKIMMDLLGSVLTPHRIVHLSPSQ